MEMQSETFMIEGFAAKGRRNCKKDCRVDGKRLILVGCWLFLARCRCFSFLACFL